MCRTRCARVLVVTALLACAPAALAVGWTDDDGVVHFTDPPKVRRVDIYMTSWCPACRKAREWFQDRGVRFTEYDVEQDERAAQRKRRIDGSTTIPVVVIDGEVIRGFRPKEFRSVLARRTDETRQKQRPPASNRPPKWPAPRPSPR